MSKGGKRYFKLTNNDGKWFAHSTEESLSRETCTNTDIMLTQPKPSFPKALNSKRYPKCEPDKKPRDYPFSSHDNKHAFKDSILVFTDGVGRRKCIHDQRQHNSHFCPCDTDGAPRGRRPNLTIQQTDYLTLEGDDAPATNKLFTHNHRHKSTEAAAVAQAGEDFMWFSQL